MGESLTVRPITNLSNQTRDATHIFVHTLYNSTTMQNDVAVIRVRWMVHFYFILSNDLIN